MPEAWRRIVSTSGSRLYAALMGVITLAITARYLGPEGRGHVATITTWAGLFAIFGSLSLGQIALHRAVGASAQKAAWLPSAFRVLLSMTVLVSVAGWLIVALLQASTSLFASLHWSWLLFGFLLLPPMLWEQYGGSLLMAQEQLQIGNRAMVIGRTLSALLVIALVAYAAWGVTGAIIATLLGQWFSSAWILLHLLGPARPLRRPSAAEIGDYVRDGLKLHLNAVGAFLISGMDVLMVGHFRGPAETGLYQLSVQLTLMLLIVPQAAAMVVYGAVSRSGARDGWPVHRRLLWQTLLLMVVVGAIAGVAAPWWLPMLAGVQFLPAIEIFRWQLLGIVGSTFSIVMAPQWIARGYFWQASTLTVAVGVANFVGNLLLIPRFGMHGAVWSSLACSALAIVGNGSIAMLCEAESRSTA
ncbi:MAG: oligosaccharide flippase family protein [Burkholderiaceae bacterium]